MSPKLKKGIRWAISAAILVFLIVFARTIDWHAAWSSMRHASLPLLAAAIGVNILSVLIKGVRWWLFLRPIGITSLPLAIRATVAGAGLNNVLVANGGDAARVVFVSRVSGVKSSTVLASMALEKLFDPIGFVMLVVFGVLVFELPPQFEAWKLPAEITLAVIILLLIFFVYATRHIKPEHVPERRAKPRTLKGKVIAYFKSFGQTAGRLATGPRFLAAMALSLLSWGCQLWTFDLAASAAHVPIPLAGSLACLLGINVGLIIRATPRNLTADSDASDPAAHAARYRARARIHLQAREGRQGDRSRRQEDRGEASHPSRTALHGGRGSAARGQGRNLTASKKNLAAQSSRGPALERR